MRWHVGRVSDRLGVAPIGLIRLECAAAGDGRCSVGSARAQVGVVRRRGSGGDWSAKVRCIGREEGLQVVRTARRVGVVTVDSIGRVEEPGSEYRRG